MLLYEELGSDLDILCEEVVGKIQVYPEMMALLARVACSPHVRAIVVTCGLQKIWEKILRRNGMAHVKVIGGGKMENGYVVTPEVKGAIAAKLKSQDLRVIAFGDSPLDIDMLKNADEAYIVVGEEAHRSHSMDKALSAAIDSGLSARQILLPDSTSPRLDTTRLAISHLSASATMARIFHRAFFHATHKPISKLLQAPTRNATVSGPNLRKAHARIGFYLATSYLSQILGLSPHPMPHVQGHTTQGHTLTNEQTTLIVPLMRGGEPLAMGISKALPLASFAHATSYACLAPALLAHTRALILVDSVVNTGASLLEFLVPLRRQFPRLRVVVVAGVVQADALRRGALGRVLVSDPGVCLVALRRSENAFVGKGGTDTGDRLFNTTFLD
ncbi:uracil phosphoribosyltransferase-domain-containing protein [Ampelomyces quisqualis]|uniref:Uracil phosphoribosyltransferase-domain-containing protein n=1 Tax=Ampelomyces quisqualis TaxID=50730 RepID=A0A6A5QPU6_AMPQU|nr:uracil phosphoribosyltransferase-domain-containing protein [Ampelomyces quisqualis]